MDSPAAPTIKQFDLDPVLLSLARDRFPNVGQLALRRRVAEMRRAYLAGDRKVRTRVDRFAKDEMLAGRISAVEGGTLSDPVVASPPLAPARPTSDQVTDAIKRLTILQLPDGTPEHRVHRVHRAAEMAANYGKHYEVTRLVDGFIADPDTDDIDFPL